MLKYTGQSSYLTAISKHVTETLTFVLNKDKVVLVFATCEMTLMELSKSYFSHLNASENVQASTILTSSGQIP